MFLLLFLFLLPGLPCSPDCLEFTVGSCNPDPGQIINTFPLPDTAEKWKTCEDLCEIAQDCDTWSLQCALSSCPCTLYQYSYLHTCHVVGGGVDTNLEVSLNTHQYTLQNIFMMLSRFVWINRLEVALILSRRNVSCRAARSGLVR